MNPYRWVCHVCAGANEPGAAHCAACGFPAIASAVEIERERIRRGAPHETAMSSHLSNTESSEAFHRLSAPAQATLMVFGVILVVAALIARAGPIGWELVAVGVMLVAGALIWFFTKRSRATNQEDQS